MIIPAAELPPIIASRYRPLRLIATGGMGAVYEVEHVGTGEHLALKLLLAGMGASPSDVERFKREARVSARIESEYVVRVTDADTAPEIGGTFFFVMELLEGMTLERAATLSTPAPGVVIAWLRQAARAVDEAHHLGIIHRDLKPENLFLATLKGGRSIVKVLDFGIAKMVEEGTGATGTGQVLGTPRYMAPEQAIATVPVTPATDRYALGLVAYRLLMGESYYRGGAMVILAELLHGDLQAPSERGSRLGPAFDAWFSKACHRDPHRRFASAREQIEALAEAIDVPREGGDGDRLLASPPLPAETANKADRPRVPTAGARSPILIASLVTGGLAVAVILGVSLARRTAAPSSQQPASEAFQPSVADSDPTPSAPWRRNTGVWGNAPDDVWVAGYSATSHTGTLSHWDGKTWTGAAGGPFPAIWGLWGAGPGDLWAVTDGGGILHQTTAGWTMHGAPTGSRAALLGIWGRRGGRDIWIVGAGGTVLHWNGTAWSDVDAGVESHTLVGVWGSGLLDVWVVGDKGAIRHWDGRAWATFPSGVAGDLFDIWGDDPTNVWVVGSAGTVLHWDGTSWSPSGKETDDDLMGVWGSGRDDVWAGGFGGALLHWDGVTWTAVPSGTTQTLNEIWGTGRDDVWAVGANGTVLRWNGRTWSAGPR